MPSTVHKIRASECGDARSADGFTPSWPKVICMSCLRARWRRLMSRPNPWRLPRRASRPRHPTSAWTTAAPTSRATDAIGARSTVEPRRRTIRTLTRRGRTHGRRRFAGRRSGVDDPRRGALLRSVEPLIYAAVTRTRAAVMLAVREATVLALGRSRPRKGRARRVHRLGVRRRNRSRHLRWLGARRLRARVVVRWYQIDPAMAGASTAAAVGRRRPVVTPNPRPDLGGVRFRRDGFRPARRRGRPLRDPAVMGAGALPAFGGRAVRARHGRRGRLR
jgi:hypothetical protein